jgi:hypothetical protein
MKKPVKSAAKDKGVPMPSRNTMDADEKRWRAEDAMRTLMRAEELKKDKKLMSDVQKMAKEQAAKMSGLCGKASK